MAESDSSAAKRRERKLLNFDPRWLLILVVVIAVMATAIYVNVRRTDNSANKVTTTIDADNGDLKINWDRYPTRSVELSETLNITQSGTYHLTGTIDDGLIVVRAGSDGVVRLILDNIYVANSEGPAIACYSADDLVIELVGENVLADGATYSSDYDADVTGAIYSKADLTFQGDGALNLTANYLDGIVGKDDVKFNSGVYTIAATDDGVRGKDSVYVVGGDFTIKAGADGIKSTNETDTGKGFALIEDGNFNLTTGAKGIKAVNSILVHGGSFAIDSTDDAVHSNNYIGIIGGAFNISSGDDGMHADRELIIDGGEIVIAKSYEGLEAQAVTVNGGSVSIVSSDDGINAGGGNDNSANNRPGAGMFDADENCVLTVNGGEVYVNASGDGLDSNGWLYFNGGTVTVDGPTNNGNGALDSGMGIVMNGGSVIAVGSSGMAETLGSSSSVYNVSIYLSAAQAAGTVIEIRDSSGNAVVSHTAAKTFNHIAVGTEAFELGQTYTIYLNGEKYESFTISNITTTVGSSTMNQMTPPGQGGAPSQNGQGGVRR